MEITVPCQAMHIPESTLNCKKLATLSSCSVQIQLPLQRPKQKSINLTAAKPSKYSPIAACSISDSLRLLDILKIPITPDLYHSFIEECTKTRDRFQAIQLHDHIRTSSLRPSLSIFNRLLLMYASCHCLGYAQKLFERMSVRSFCSWAAMIAGCFENGQYQQVVDLFVEMRCWQRGKVECGDLDETAVCVIVVCVLKACARTMNMDLGKQMHCWIITMGYAQNLVLSSSLMSFYGEVGYAEGSACVFYQVRDQNKAVWTAKIVSYCNEKQYVEAINTFRDMGKEGVKRNSFVFCSVLRACAKMEDGGCCGQQVHATVIKAGLELNENIQCGLVEIYGKFGLIKEASKIFNMHGNYQRNISCWNAILAANIEEGLGFEALSILQ